MSIKLVDFDTIILDLDYTIWYGCEPLFWAKKLTFPVTLHGLRLVDSVGKYITLDKDIKQILRTLSENGKRIGFVTRGGLLNVEHTLQPPVMCLAKFGLLDYFTYCQHVLYKTDKKSTVIRAQEKTLFIDDTYSDIQDVEENCSGITSLNRNSFTSWTSVLE